jgi:hypothetical protein
LVFVNGARCTPTGLSEGFEGLPNIFAMSGEHGDRSGIVHYPEVVGQLFSVARFGVMVKGKPAVYRHIETSK